MLHSPSQPFPYCITLHNPLKKSQVEKKIKQKFYQMNLTHTHTTLVQIKNAI